MKEYKKICEFKDECRRYHPENILCTKLKRRCYDWKQFLNKKLIEKNIAEDSEKRIKNMQKKNTLLFEYISLEKKLNDL